MRISHNAQGSLSVEYTAEDATEAAIDNEVEAMIRLVDSLKNCGWQRHVRAGDFGRMRCETQTSLELIAGKAMHARQLIKLADSASGSIQ